MPSVKRGENKDRSACSSQVDRSKIAKPSPRTSSGRQRKRTTHATNSPALVRNLSKPTAFGACPSDASIKRIFTIRNLKGKYTWSVQNRQTFWIYSPPVLMMKPAFITLPAFTFITSWHVEIDKQSHLGITWTDTHFWKNQRPVVWTVDSELLKSSTFQVYECLSTPCSCETQNSRVREKGRVSQHTTETTPIECVSLFAAQHWSTSVWTPRGYFILVSRVLNFIKIGQPAHQSQ